jgi:hypothetical protein
MHTSTLTRNRQQPSIVARVRAISPHRPLSFADSLRIAELQAAKLLQLTGCTEGPVPESIITDLPRIDVQRSAKLIGCGLTTWSRGQWRIRINASDSATRQRFTLAHELKHVLDAAHEHVIYRHLPNGEARRRHIEAICDAFAAALLMPRPWVKQHWYGGIQDLAALAWHFEVSLQAMHIRLQTLGLIERTPFGRHAFEVGHTALRGSQRHHHRISRPRRLSQPSGRQTHVVVPPGLDPPPQPASSPGVVV